MKNLLDQTGIIKKGELFINKTNLDVSNWRVKVYQDQDYMILLEKFKDGKFQFWYDFMLEKEEDIPKFFAETDWEIEWEGDINPEQVCELTPKGSCSEV